VRFLWAQAVQTTCAYCRSVLVRRDLDLERVGAQADFPATGSPIQIGTEGTWRGGSFLVVGRLTYQWERGRWNEWHCRTQGDRSVWLSDAQLEYAITMQVEEPGAVIDPRSLRVGDIVPVAGRRFEVATLTRAQYVGTEGELPFTSYDRETRLFVDLQDADGGLATIDTSDTPPTVYAGEYVSFDDLALRGLREFEGW
jgi:hypothetical protein